MERHPAVAGQFYPSREAELREMVQGMLPAVEQKEAVLGVISPHAGYIYSGAIAGKVFAKVKMPRKVIILGPNHHGYGQPGAVYPSGSWRTPLGAVPVDEELAGEILRTCPGVHEDIQAHRFEHSLEVQVPFLQVLTPEVKIVPICLGHRPLHDLLELGSALGDLLRGREEKALLLASSDMTHFESGPQARKKDMEALDRVLALDPEGLYRVVRQKQITMCGVIPAVVMLNAALNMGASRANLVEYGNSGHVTGDQEQVVGYAGVTVS